MIHIKHIILYYVIELIEGSQRLQGQFPLQGQFQELYNEVDQCQEECKLVNISLQTIVCLKELKLTNKHKNTYKL